MKQEALDRLVALKQQWKVRDEEFGSGFMREDEKDIEVMLLSFLGILLKPKNRDLGNRFLEKAR